MEDYAEIIYRVQKMRDETVKTCEDVVLSDGTVAYTREQGLEMVNLYDELLGKLR